MIALTKIRDLGLSAAANAGRPAHLSAASGLVRVESFIYVVADDEHHLGVFRAGVNDPGRLVRLFDGDLPDSKKKRKKRKPDLEALTLVPAFGDYPDGALLALGSGSRPNRFLGALLGLDTQGALRGAPRIVDLAPILVPLENEFPALNIEGAVVCGGELRLFQRGNKRNAENAVIRFPVLDLLAFLQGEPAASMRQPDIHRVDLGWVEEIPLSFTDAAALGDGAMVFTAVAEDTDDSYEDGRCAAAAVGIIDGQGHLRCLHPLDHPHKVEGVDARADGDLIRLLLVTDADDHAVPAGLYSAEMSP